MAPRSSLPLQGRRCGGKEKNFWKHQPQMGVRGGRKEKKYLNNTRVLGLNRNQVLQTASGVHLHRRYQGRAGKRRFPPPQTLGRLQLPARLAAPAALPPHPLSHPRSDPRSLTHKRVAAPPFYPFPSPPPLLAAHPGRSCTSQGKGGSPDRALTDLHSRASPSSATLTATRLTGT